MPSAAPVELSAAYTAVCVADEFSEGTPQNHNRSCSRPTYCLSHQGIGARSHFDGLKRKAFPWKGQVLSPLSHANCHFLAATVIISPWMKRFELPIQSHTRQGMTLLALTCCCAIAGCDPGDDDERRAGPQVQRLTELLDAAQLTVAELPTLESGVPPSYAEPPLLAEHFEGEPAGRWLFAQELAHPRHRPPIVTSDGCGRTGSRALVIHPALGGALLYLPAEPRASYAISAWVRESQREATSTPQLLVASVAAAPDVADPAPEEDPEQRFRTVGPRRTARVMAEDAEHFMRLSLIVGPCEERKGFRLLFYPGAGAAVLDDVEVRRLTPLEEIATRSLVPGESFSHPLRRKVSLRGSTRDCIVLPPPSLVTFKILLPEQQPVLELATAAYGRVLGARSRLSVLVNGVRLAERQLVLAASDLASGFVDWRLELSQFAGQEVQLSLQVEPVGDRAPIVLAAHPVVRAGRGGKMPRKLVLISLDTLRPDHLSCYGYALQTSPSLDALAQRSFRFACVRAPSSYTLPTHVTLFSGQHPVVHGVVTMSDRIDVTRTPMLAAELRERGYLTAAFTGGGLVDPTFGFDRGFDRYDVLDPAGAMTPGPLGDRWRWDSRLGRNSRSDAAAIGAWIEEHRQAPFFLFVHTFLVHNYAPDAAHREAFDRDCGMGAIDQDLFEAVMQSKVTDPALRAHLAHLYDATIAQADALLVRPLIESLQRSNQFDETVIAVVSDHGEEFVEHGSLGHGRTLFEEVVRVPWILHVPGSPGGLVPDAISTEVIAPTLRQLLGVGSDARAAVRAFDLAMTNRVQDPLLLDVMVGEEHHQALLQGSWKLHARWSENTEHEPLLRLYDLSTDPGERSDLVQAQPEMVARLGRQLEQLRADLLTRRVELGSAEGAPVPLSDEVASRLRELGYLGR
jgi:arylsulfatase A-like enzyme